MTFTAAAAGCGRHSAGEARWSHLQFAARRQALLMEGRLAEARVAFWQEVEEAEPAGDAAALAEAAIGLGGLWVHEHRATLERARGAARAAARPRRARPRRAVWPAGCAAVWPPSAAYLGGERQPLLDELDGARRCGDPVALAEVLSVAHHCLLGPAVRRRTAGAGRRAGRQAPRSPAARPTR